jgi:hypothetical protein
LFIFLLSAAALFVSADRCTKLGDGGRWVSYTAQCTETVTTRDASGATTSKQTLTDELRSEDGAVLSIVKENGQATSGRLWQADGHKYSLDYI